MSTLPAVDQLYMGTVFYTTAYPSALQYITTKQSSQVQAQLLTETQSYIQQSKHILPIKIQNINYNECGTIELIIQHMIVNENAAYGIIPCENSETGSFRTVYELLKQYQLYIVGEFACTSTVQHNEWLATRYIVICRQPCNTELLIQQSNIHLKSTAVMRLSHRPAAVFKILSCFALRDVNVLKFQGLPTRSTSTTENTRTNSLTSVLPMSTTSDITQQWEYQFLVDYEPSKLVSVNNAVDAALREFSLQYHSLGTYVQNLKQLTTDTEQSEQNNMVTNSAYA